MYYHNNVAIVDKLKQSHVVRKDYLIQRCTTLYSEKSIWIIRKKKLTEGKAGVMKKNYYDIICGRKV
jgi:hypothetical protein